MQFIVNWHILEQLSASLYEADDDPAWPSDFDPDSERSVKDIIRTWALPSFVAGCLGLPDPCGSPGSSLDIHADFPNKAVYKLNLRYYLTTKNALFDRMIGVGYPPFETGEDSFVFFRWYWEVWFPNEAYHLESVDNFVERLQPGWYDFEYARAALDFLNFS